MTDNQNQLGRCTHAQYDSEGREQAFALVRVRGLKLLLEAQRVHQIRNRQDGWTFSKCTGSVTRNLMLLLGNCRLIIATVFLDVALFWRWSFDLSVFAIFAPFWSFWPRFTIYTCSLLSCIWNIHAILCWWSNSHIHWFAPQFTHPFIHLLIQYFVQKTNMYWAPTISWSLCQAPEILRK